MLTRSLLAACPLTATRTGALMLESGEAIAGFLCIVIGLIAAIVVAMVLTQPTRDTTGS